MFKSDRLRRIARFWWGKEYRARKWINEIQQHFLLIIFYIQTNFHYWIFETDDFRKASHQQFLCPYLLLKFHLFISIHISQHFLWSSNHKLGIVKRSYEWLCILIETKQSKLKKYFIQDSKCKRLNKVKRHWYFLKSTSF